MKVLANGVWQTTNFLVDASQPWEVTRVVTKYMRKGSFYLFNTKLEELTIQTCVQHVVEDGSNTILLVRDADLNNLQHSLSGNQLVFEPNVGGSSEHNREDSLERPARRPRPGT